MEKRNRAQQAAMVLEVIGMAAAVLLSCFLLYRYLRQGEGAAATTGTEKNGDPDTDADTDADPDRNPEADGNGVAAEESAAAETTEVPEAPASLLKHADTETAVIRVRILDDAFEDDVFDSVRVSSKGGLIVLREGEGGQQEEGESFSVESRELKEGDSLLLRPAGKAGLSVENLQRAGGTPEYAGVLRLIRERTGIALINEVSLEEYLCSVVSSEMPSYYPLEAQKAQAVCARTYALLCMERAKNGKNNSDLDDSVNFQVYNNYQSTETSREAVASTAGEILSLESIQYYSTSCLSEHRTDLQDEEAFRTFLMEAVPEGAEYGSAWVRWETGIPENQILERLWEQYGINADNLEEIAVTSRKENGRAETLLIRAGTKETVIEGEYEIRRFLSPAPNAVILTDGSEAPDLRLLPSAFFCIETEVESASAGETKEGGADAGEARETKEGGADAGETEEESAGAGDAGETEEAVSMLRIVGGGYGHGNGMSQCGAAQMASEGAGFEEILAYYYGE